MNCVLVPYCCSARQFGANSLAPTRRFDTPHGGDEEERNHRSHFGGHDDDDNAFARRSSGNTGKRDHSDSVSVDTIANGQLEVNLLDIGVSAEDIAAMRRIDARNEEA